MLENTGNFHESRQKQNSLKHYFIDTFLAIYTTEPILEGDILFRTPILQNLLISNFLCALLAFHSMSCFLLTAPCHHNEFPTYDSIHPKNTCLNKYHSASE